MFKVFNFAFSKGGQLIFLLFFVCFNCGFSSPMSVDYSLKKNSSQMSSCDPSTTSYVVFSATEINTNVTVPAGSTWLVTNTITIKNGGTFKIDGEVLFQPGKGVLVQTGGSILIGGTMNSCSGRWKGITVAGGTFFMSGGAILSADYPLYCSSTLNGNGSFIHINGGYFTDITYGAITLDGVTLSNLLLNQINVTNALNGIELRGITSPSPNVLASTFSYCSNAGIQTDQSFTEVTQGCNFINCKYGILSYGYLRVGSDVSSSPFSNTFTSCERGIYAIAGNIATRNNNYNNCGWGNYFAANSSFVSADNVFNGTNGGYPEGFYSNGMNASQLSERNEYNANEGIFPANENNFYQFTRCCFNTNYWAVNVPTDSYIEEEQGSSFNTSRNCFGPNGVDLAYFSPLEMKYWLPSNATSFPCVIPTNPGNYITPMGNSINSTGCNFTASNTNPTRPTWQQTVVNFGCNKTLLLQFINQQTGIINALDAKRLLNGGLSASDQTIFVRTNTYLSFAIRQFYDCFIMPEKPQTVLALKQMNTSANNFKVGIYIALLLKEAGEVSEAVSILNSYALNAANYDLARSIILSMTHNDLSDRGHREKSYLTLNILSLPSNATILSSDLALLNRVALTDDVYAGYGRWLLYYLTGQMVEPTIPTATVPEIRSKQSSEKLAEKYSVSPIPANQNITFDIENIDYSSKYTIVITNLVGNSVYSSEVFSPNINIDVTNLNSGLFILTLNKNDVNVFTKKVVISK